MSCPVSVYRGRVGCPVLFLYTVIGWGVKSCVCNACHGLFLLIGIGRGLFTVIGRVCIL